MTTKRADEGKQPSTDLVHPRSRRQDRSVVEIDEVERIHDEPRPQPKNWQRRAWRVAAPAVLGMVIDASDLVATLNVPLFPVGCLLGFLWSGYLDVPPTWRMVITFVTGVYLIAPFTASIPAATIMGVIVQVFHPRVLKREPFA